MTPEKLVLYLELQGYDNVRMIGDVACGTLDYLTTRGLCVGMSAWSVGRRYCYQNREEADAALAVYTDPDAHPTGNWIKVKGEYRGEWIDAMNPNHPDLQPWDKVAPK